MKLLCYLLALVCASVSPSFVFSQGTEPAIGKTSRLRLLDTAVFGKRTTEPIVLLLPQQPGDLDPETVMVDIEKGQYYAATVRYPKEITFESARESLNKAYGKWEKATFADDPEMGIWRNEDDQFSVQLTEDGFNTVVIYIKFSMVTGDKFMEGVSRAALVTDDEEKALKAVATMRAVLDRGEFDSFYRSHCHTHLREQIERSDFVNLMNGDRGKEIIQLFATVHDAIKHGKGRDILISRFNVRDSEEFEFVLVQAQRRAHEGQRWHIELRKEDGMWRLMDFD